MDTSRILSELRAERDRIDQAIAALEALDNLGRRGRRRNGSGPAQPAPAQKKQTRSRGRMSPAARKRMSAMMKQRWAERRKAKAA
ncbi:MAG TPA: hypothetical protein VEG32_04245 [Clostridia bacterium]|nr:hypothetical protein [Clostridia bacterium]